MPSWHHPSCFSYSPPSASTVGTWMKYPLWKGWRLTIGSVAWDSTYQGCLSCCCCWMSNLRATETILHPWYNTILQVGYIGPLSILEGPAFPCHRNRHNFQIGVCFSCFQSLSKYHRLSLLSIIFTSMGSHIISYQTGKPILWKSKCRSGPISTGSTTNITFFTTWNLSAW